mmetsp:Transcript_234/g.921  ORF Transcript_234/g.921 Transcript_234/m.921 type:complete len:393 (+) Transcript_234:346-1524(+)
MAEPRPVHPAAHRRGRGEAPESRAEGRRWRRWPRRAAAHAAGHDPGPQRQRGGGPDDLLDRDRHVRAAQLHHRRRAFRERGGARRPRHPPRGRPADGAEAARGVAEGVRLVLPPDTPDRQRAAHAAAGARLHLHRRVRAHGPAAPAARVRPPAPRGAHRDEAGGGRGAVRVPAGPGRQAEEAADQGQEPRRRGGGVRVLARRQRPPLAGRDPGRRRRGRRGQQGGGEAPRPRGRARDQVRRRGGARLLQLDHRRQAARAGAALARLQLLHDRAVARPELQQTHEPPAVDGDAAAQDPVLAQQPPVGLEGGGEAHGAQAPYGGHALRQRHRDEHARLQEHRPRDAPQRAGEACAAQVARLRRALRRRPQRRRPPRPAQRRPAAVAAADAQRLA